MYVHHLNAKVHCRGKGSQTFLLARKCIDANVFMGNFWILYLNTDVTCVYEYVTSELDVGSLLWYMDVTCMLCNVWHRWWCLGSGVFVSCFGRLCHQTAELPLLHR